MNAFLDWLGQKQHRLIVLYCVFTLSAWWILKSQIEFSAPLTQIETVTELTMLSTLKNATVLTRWAAIVLDHGLQLNLLFKAIRLEDWTFLILGILFCFPVEKRKVSTLVRTVMISELGLNVGLGLTFLSAFNSTDTLAILNSVRWFAQIELGVSLALMIVLFIYVLRLIFHEYAD